MVLLLKATLKGIAATLPLPCNLIAPFPSLIWVNVPTGSLSVEQQNPTLAMHLLYSEYTVWECVIYTRVVLPHTL